MSQLSSILHGSSAKGDNHDSVVARLGQLGQKYTDPLAWIFGRKYTDKLVDIADWSNKQFSSVAKRDPQIKFDQEHGLAHALGLQKEGQWTINKPVDTAAILAAAYFGGGALAGGLGGGSAAAGGGTGALGAGSAGAGLGSAGGAAGTFGAGADVIPTVTVTGSTGSSALGFAGGAGLGAGSLYSSNPGPGDANSNDLFQRQLAGRTNFSTGQPTGGANSISSIPGSDMPGSSASPAANMSTNDYIKLGMQLMNPGQQQQNAAAPVIPQRTAQAMSPVTMGAGQSGVGGARAPSMLGTIGQQPVFLLGNGLGKDSDTSFQAAYQREKNARAARRSVDLGQSQSDQERQMDANPSWPYGSLMYPGWRF